MSANTDQWVNSMVGGDQTLLPEMHRAMVRAALLDGEVHVVEDGIDETSRAEVCSSGYGSGRTGSVGIRQSSRALVLPSAEDPGLCFRFFPCR